MTVSANDTIERDVIDGTGPYPYTFRIFSASDLMVRAIGDDETPYLLTNLSHYTVSGENSPSGGSVTLTAGAASTYDGYEIDIRSATPLTQPTSIRNQGRFLPEGIEDAFDRLERQIQDMDRRLKNCVQIPDTEQGVNVTLPARAVRAGILTSFDADGNVAITTPITQVFSQGVLDTTLAASNTYAGTNAVPLNLRTYIEDDGHYNAMGFIPANLKAAIRNFTSASDVSGYVGYALTAAAAEGVMGVRLRGGKYIIGSELQIGDGITLVGAGQGGTRLYAGTAGQRILRLFASNANVRGLGLYGNAQANVVALALAPVDETDLLTRTDIDHNRIMDLLIYGTAEGIYLRAGPHVGAFDSGNFYNRFRDIHVLNCTRGIWLRPPPNVASSPNRNTFSEVRVSADGTGSCNTGLQIDGGSTNKFVNCDFEGIAGVGPNTTATAAYIAADDGTLDNNDNHFFDSVVENCTQHLYNENASTALILGDWDATKFATGGSTVKPAILIPTQPSRAPLIMLDQSYGEGISGYPSGYRGITKEIADTGLNWQDYAVTTAAMTNATSVGTANSKYRQFNSRVRWDLSITFRATVAGTDITITPPVLPNAALYTTLSSQNPFYTLTVFDAVANRVVAAGFNTSTRKLFIKAPTTPSSGWDTTGNNNALWISIEYGI